MSVTRRGTLGLLAGGLAAAATRAQVAPACSVAAVDAACAPVLALLPEAATRAGLENGDADRRCDLRSPEGSAALAAAVRAAAAALPGGCAEAAAARAVLDRAAATGSLRYGWNDPTAAIHQPYRVSPWRGPHVETVAALAMWQPVDTPAALDAWHARLDALGDALLAAAAGVRADQGAGCVPPLPLGRATLLGMDALLSPRPAAHPLVQALAARVAPADRDTAAARAAATLERRMLPALALLRDTLATATRAGRTDAGAGALPDGATLHRSNLVRAGETRLAPAELAAMGRDEVARIAGQLDRRLAARGFKEGPLADRIAAAFAARPALVAADDAAGRDAVEEAVRSRIEAAHALLGTLVPPALAATPPLGVARVPALPTLPAGSFYLPEGAGRAATLWLDLRSTYALPIPGASPLAFRLGLPGEHLLAAGAVGVARARLAAAARWPALADGWGGYAARLAAEHGLFARDSWGDVARLSDELLRAARLVVDVGIHADGWARERADAEMVAMTGAPQAAAVDRIVALPGEAASGTPPLQHLLALRTAARGVASRHFDAKTFHATLLTGGPRPLPEAASS